MMPYVLPVSSMPEAEVSLRFAFHLLDKGLEEDYVEVAIDGAQVQVGSRKVFPIVEFLASCGWAQNGKPGGRWQGDYIRSGKTLRVHSTPGKGDVVGVLTLGSKRIRAECKKGPLQRSASSEEYPLLRECLGQLVSLEHVEEGDVLVAVVPHSPKFQNLAGRFREAPAIRRFGIRIATVSRDGIVEGLQA